MKQRFRLFIVRHQNGVYWVSLPGIDDIELASGYDDRYPAVADLSASGHVLDEVKREVHKGLERWLPLADPEWLARSANLRDGQALKVAQVELRPHDRRGARRNDKVKMTFSLLVEPEEDGQRLVRVPRVKNPPLCFHWHPDDKLEDVAARELAAFFGHYTIEELQKYQYGRQEYLDEIEVSFTPVSPGDRVNPEDEKRKSGQALGAACTCLSDSLSDRVIRRAYRQERIVDEVLASLASARQPSVVLSGPPEVGKSAIILDVVKRISSGDCPERLKGRKVYETSPDHLIAGCCYIGEWQAKLLAIIEELRKEGDILVVRDVGGLTEAGKHSKGDENMAMLLRPYIADGSLLIIGETNDDRRRALETREPTFLALFRVIDVREPGRDETLSIIGSAAADIERHHSVRIEPAVLDASYDLCRRFMPYRAFPGKAVRFVERVAAETQAAADRTKAPSAAPVVTRQYATSAFARLTGLPEFLLSDHLSLDPVALEKHFSARLIGQPDAVRTVTDLVTIVKAGLNDPHKPLGCLFFVGPTGVGKTEMAKALAEYLFGSQDRMIRFDMSEYAEPYNIGRLIGSPDGRAEGELTARIRTQPFSVVLLDEFEKAHASVFDVMLQVLGEGRLTDAGGRTADFRSAIIVMTSNLGASARERSKPGLRAGSVDKAQEAHYRKAVEGFFRPEFVNRFDHVVVFRSLDREAMRAIAQIEVERLLSREGVTRRGIAVTVEEPVYELLLQAGFSPQYGARPLKRAIEQRIIVPLARYLVTHQVGAHDMVRIARENDDVCIETRALATVRRSSAADDTEALDPAKMSLDEAIDVLAEVRRSLHGWRDSNAAEQARLELTGLLARTRKPAFAKAKDHGEVWERIQHLDRLTRRLAQLVERAEYLEELALLCRREHSDRYLTELVGSTVDLRRSAAFLEIELLASPVAQASGAVLRIVTVGARPRGVDGLPWTTQLVFMYRAWAMKKGYDTQVIVPAPDPEHPEKPPWKTLAPGLADDALAKRLADVGAAEVAVSVRGHATFALLLGEFGTHKRINKAGDESAGASWNAAVRVEALRKGTTGEGYLNAAWKDIRDRRAKGEEIEEEETPPIIRTYVLDREKVVRDMRTGLRTNQVWETLGGQLDDFVVAFLRTPEGRMALDGD